MPHWYWDKKALRSTPSQSPPLSANGANHASANALVMDYDTEMRYRREGAR